MFYAEAVSAQPHARGIRISALHSIQERSTRLVPGLKRRMMSCVPSRRPGDPGQTQHRSCGNDRHDAPLGHAVWAHMDPQPDPLTTPCQDAKGRPPLSPRDSQN